MWSITTSKIEHNPNRTGDGDVENFVTASDVPGCFPTRWFWSDELRAWTRNVAKRTYYKTKKEAEAAVVLVAGMFPEMLGQILVLAASDIAIENLMNPRKKKDEENPF